MSKARDLANAGTALTTVSATELGYLDGVTSAVQTQVDAKIAKSTVTAKGDLLVATGSGTVVAQPIGTDGQFLKANSAQSDGVEWATVSQYALPSQTGNSGKFLTTNGTAESWGTVTTPPVWTPRLDGTGSTIMAIAYNGSNLYVAAGNDGKLYSSSDGKTWTSRTSGFGTNNIRDVAYGNGLWVAVGSVGTLTTSTDGITWTARTSNMGTNIIYKVIYANSLWVAVGNGGGSTNTGGIIYSTDGITWTRKSQSLAAVAAGYYDVIWNGTNWIVGADYGTSANYLYATTPSGTWTAANSGDGGNFTIFSLIWDGTRTVYVTSNNQTFQTSSTTLASITGLSNGLNLATSYQGAKSVYNGVIHTGARYYTRFLTTSTSYATIYQGSLFPFTFDNGGGTLTGNTLTAIYVNATGTIVADSTGRIYTSF